MVYQSQIQIKFRHQTLKIGGAAAKAAAFIRVTDTSGNVLGVSEHLVKTDSEYTRLIVPFELEDFHTYFVGNCGILVHNALCHELGKAGEKAAGIEKNTKTISMNGRNRIPDGYNPNMWVQEVKNVKSQSLTSQLKDDFIFASQNKLKMELYVRQTTHLTKPLQNAIKTFGVIVRYLP